MRAPPRLFGTNGIREVVGERLTAPFAVRVARAVATVVPPRSRVIVGWDGRTSSVALSRIVSSTLTLAGHSVVELGLLPTPAIQYSVPRLNGQLGVIVTASHNPPEFNGFKCIAADGLEVPREVESAIEAAFAADLGATVPYPEVGTVTTDRLAADRYVEGIVAQVAAPRIASRRFTVALDCANGTAVATSPELLRRLGCRTVTLNGQVDGTFPGRPSEPTERNVAELCRLVPSVGADLGVAHDGDADRAAFVDAQGRYVAGDQLFTLLAVDAVERHHGGVVVSTVAASQAVEDAVTAAGGSFVPTKVGSPAITHEMQRQHAVFGGEDNGGFVRPEFQLARDGGMTLATVLDLLSRTDRPLHELLRGVPRYALVRETVPCPVALRAPVLEALALRLKAESERLVTLDGLKAYRDGGWVLLRPSGTEPIFRVVAEAKEPTAARRLADAGVAAVREAVAAASASPAPPG